MNNTLKPFLKMAAEPVRKAIELKPVKATSKELSTYSIKALRAQMSGMLNTTLK